MKYKQTLTVDCPNTGGRGNFTFFKTLWASGDTAQLEQMGFVKTDETKTAANGRVWQQYKMEIVVEL